MTVWTDWTVRYVGRTGRRIEKSFRTEAARSAFLTRGFASGAVSQVEAYADPTPAPLTVGDAVRHSTTGETGVVVGREHSSAVQVQTTPGVTVVWYDVSCVTI
jgi:hypothetical protein